MPRRLRAGFALALFLTTATAGATVREKPESSPLWLDVRISRYQDPARQTETLIGLAVGTDGGRATSEFRVGSYAYSVGARLDPGVKSAPVLEISVWCVRKYGAGKSFVEVSTVHRVPLRFGARTVLARRLHGGETTVVSATLRR